MKELHTNHDRLEQAPPHGRKRDKNFAARLLSRKDDVTIHEREQVLDNILRQVASENNVQPDPGKIHWSNGIRIVAALAAFIILGVTGIAIWTSTDTDSDAPEFIARGVDTPPPFFEASCMNENNDTTCVPGCKLTFSIHELETDSYFAAFAIRNSDNLVIWMFPTRSDEKSIAVSTRAKTLSEAIVLDSLYVPGDYEIIGVLSDRALEQHEIRPLVTKDAAQNNGIQHTIDGVPARISRVKMRVENL